MESFIMFLVSDHNKIHLMAAALVITVPLAIDYVFYSK